MSLFWTLTLTLRSPVSLNHFPVHTTLTLVCVDDSAIELTHVDLRFLCCWIPICKAVRFRRWRLSGVVWYTLLGCQVLALQCLSADVICWVASVVVLWFLHLIICRLICIFSSRCNVQVRFLIQGARHQNTGVVLSLHREAITLA